MFSSLRSVLRLVLVCAGIAVLSVGFSACNTVSGIGKDLESVGEKIEDAAN